MPKEHIQKGTIRYNNDIVHQSEGTPLYYLDAYGLKTLLPCLFTPKTNSLLLAHMKHNISTLTI